ncbi:MAG: nuclear transport factor 2 family protein [Acidimicrobiia bacterium]
MTGADPAVIAVIKETVAPALDRLLRDCIGGRGLGTDHGRPLIWEHVAVDREAVARWVAAYEQAWRTPGTDQLADLFSPDVSYLPSPWAEPLDGLDALAPFWEKGRDGPDEPFTLASEIVAVEGSTAVVRVSVDYLGGADTSRWRDLWVLGFAPDGRCASFEEWPFAPGQPDGHEDER